MSAGSSGVITCSIRSGLMSVSASRPGWCWVEMSTVVSRFGRVVLVVDGDLGLPVGAQVREDPGLAHLGQAVGQAVGQPDRQRHEVVGLVARRSRTSSPGRRRPGC